MKDFKTRSTTTDGMVQGLRGLEGRVEGLDKGLDKGLDEGLECLEWRGEVGKGKFTSHVRSLISGILPIGCAEHTHRPDRHLMIMGKVGGGGGGWRVEGTLVGRG